MLGHPDLMKGLLGPSSPHKPVELTAGSHSLAAAAHCQRRAALQARIEPRGQLNEHSHSRSSVQYLCVRGCRQGVRLAETPRTQAAGRSTADSSAPLVSAPLTNVPRARSHVRRNPSAIRLSGSVRRPACCLASHSGDSGCGQKCTQWTAARMDFPRGGTVGLIAAIVLATMYGASAYMGPACWIPAFWAPVLLVTHYITFVVLWKYWRGAAQQIAPADAAKPRR